MDDSELGMEIKEERIEHNGEYLGPHLLLRGLRLLPLRPPYNPYHR